MKSTCAFFLIFLSLVPFSFSFSTSRLHDSPAPPVLTNLGLELQAGRSYYILPEPVPLPDFRGFLFLASNPNHSICPFNVAQQWNLTSLGDPFSFAPLPLGSDAVIREDTPLYVAVPDRPESSCPAQTVWTITNSDIVATGAPQGPGIVLWYFKIQRVVGNLRDVYKLSYCLDCIACFPRQINCDRDVSAREIGGERLLALDDKDHLTFVFVEVDRPSSII